MPAPASRKQRRKAAKAARSQARRSGTLARADRFLELGDLAAAERCYRSAHEAAPDRPEPLHGLGRVHRAAGRAQEAVTAYEAALLRSPDDAGILFELGNLARDMGMTEGAARLYQTVIALKPDAIEAHNNLGVALRQLGRLDDAIATLKPAIEQWPDSAELWQTLGTVMADAEDYGKAEQFYGEALRLKPAFGQAHGNLADTLYATGRLEEAINHYRRALKLLPDNADAHFNYARALLASGDLRYGWREHEWRLDPGFHKYVERDHGLARWDGSEITDKRILVCAEQGVGDELRFAHCFPDLIACASHCIIECDARLIALFSRSFPTASFHAWHGTSEAGRRLRNYHWLTEIDPVDLAIEAGSLPLYFRRTPGDFPPRRRLLTPDKAALETWRERIDDLGAGLKVGIAWTSGLQSHLRTRSYVPLAEFGPILGRAGIRPVNLQYGDVEAEISAAEAEFGISIAAWPDLDLKDDFDAVAALVANLDLVIAPTTAVRQLAAALDVPTFVLAAEPGITALGRDVSPYAPCMRYFVRRPGEDLATVIATVCDALNKLISESDA